MTTVFLRAKGAPPTNAAASAKLAQLRAQMLQRPAWAQGEPLAVEEATFKAAEAEMVAIRKARGFSSIERAPLAEPNFLLFGVPIVCREAA